MEAYGPEMFLYHLDKLMAQVLPLAFHDDAMARSMLFEMLCNVRGTAQAVQKSRQQAKAAAAWVGGAVPSNTWPPHDERTLPQLNTDYRTPGMRAQGNFEGSSLLPNNLLEEAASSVSTPPTPVELLSDGRFNHWTQLDAEVPPPTAAGKVPPISKPMVVSGAASTAGTQQQQHHYHHQQQQQQHLDQFDWSNFTAGLAQALPQQSAVPTSQQQSSYSGSTFVGGPAAHGVPGINGIHPGHLAALLQGATANGTTLQLAQQSTVDTFTPALQDLFAKMEAFGVPSIRVSTLESDSGIRSTARTLFLRDPKQFEAWKREICADMKRPDLRNPAKFAQALLNRYLQQQPPTQL